MGKNFFHQESSLLDQSRGSVSFNWKDDVTNMDRNGIARGVAATSRQNESVVAFHASNDGGYEQNCFLRRGGEGGRRRRGPMRCVSVSE